MDPLSVIASITGMLTAAAKISSTASSLIAAWKDAPTSLSGIVAEASALIACLTQLMPFLRGIERAPESRTKAISIKQIVILVSSCVLAISELQKTLDALKPDKTLSRRVKLRWASHEKKLNNLRFRVQFSTTSLNLVLTALTWYVYLFDISSMRSNRLLTVVCSSSTVEESREPIHKLERTLEHILQADSNLSRRIANINLSVKRRSHHDCISQGISDVSEDASMLTLKSNVASKTDSQPREQFKPAFGFDNEVEWGLFSSFVYLRAERRLLHSPDASSSMVSKAGWSFFSQLSLAQISDLSIVSLPISIQELWISDQYKSDETPETMYRRESTTEPSDEGLGDAHKR